MADNNRRSMTMAKPKLGSKTPDSPDTNSLIAIHDDLIARPRERRYAIVELAVTDVNTKVATGDITAVYNLVHIEEVTGKSLESALSIMDAVFTARTGASQRPGPEAEDTPLDLSGLPKLSAVE
jgi:hypothetical protein